MNRRSFLASAVAALAGSTVARGAVLPLTLTETPIELAKQAGIPVPVPVPVPVPAAVPVPVPPMAGKQVIGTTIHPALLGDTRIDIYTTIYEKVCRDFARRLDEEAWGGILDKKAFANEAYDLSKRLFSFPVRNFS
jgi:hypothetical protein